MTEPTDQATIDAVTRGYTFDEAALELGALVVGGTAHPGAGVQIPLRMTTRHGLVAGATGKTKAVRIGREIMRGLFRTARRRR